MSLFVVSGLIWFSMEKSYAHEFLFSWGSEGSKDNEFNQPFGIAIDSTGNIYVADNFNNRIQKFNRTGSHLDTWGSKGTGGGEFQKVYGMAFDSMDNLYVIDGGSNDRIQKFTSEGKFLTYWNVMIPGDNSFLNPLDIAIDSKDKIYVLENANNRIQIFDTSGNPIAILGVDDSNGVEIQDAIGIAIDPSNGIYILEFGNSQIQKFDEFGSFITKWNTYPQPSGIEIDSKGNVYILHSDSLVKFDNDGSLIYDWYSDEVGNYLFDMPNHLEVDSSDRIFVVDGGNNRISVFSQNEIKDPGFHYDAKSFGGTELIPQGITPQIPPLNPTEEDLDGDGISNIMDKCPTQPETINGYSDVDGCPDYQVPLISGLEIELTPGFMPVEHGKSTGTTINLSQEGTNSGNVTLTCNHEDDVFCEINPSKVTLGKTATSELTIFTTTETGFGQKPISIKAEGGGDEDTDSFRIEVNESTFDPIWVILLGVIFMVGALTALVIITRKRDGGKPKKLNIPNPKESRLK